MASPTVQTTAESATTTAAANHVITLPSGIVAGDLIVFVIAKGTPAVTNATFNAHGSYSELLDEAVSCGLAILYRWADGSETNPTLVSSTNIRTATVAYRISGAINPATQAPEKAGTTATGTSVNPNPPSLAPTGGSKDYLFIACWAQGGAAEQADDDTYVSAWPTNYTHSQNQKTCGVAGTNLAGLVGAASRQLTAASDDPGTATVSENTAWRAQTIAIHPAVAVAADLPLQPSAAIATTALVVTAATQLPLAAAVAVSAATLEVTVPSTTPADLPLQPAASTATTALALSAPTQLPLAPAASTATTALALTAPTQLPLTAAAASSATALALTAPTALPLAPAAAVSTATLGLSAPTELPLQPAVAVATTALAVTIPTGEVELPLQPAAATSTTSLVLTAATGLLLGAATATSTTALILTVPSGGVTELPLAPATSTANATLLLTAKTLLPLTPAAGVSNASLVLASGAPSNRWPYDTDSRWAVTAGNRWPYDTDSRWAVTAGNRWPYDTDTNWD
jgi:hypothetical protein